jgi:hypothetical protein
LLETEVKIALTEMKEENLESLEVIQNLHKLRIILLVTSAGESTCRYLVSIN